MTPGRIDSLKNYMYIFYIPDTWQGSGDIKGPGHTASSLLWARCPWP